MRPHGGYAGLFEAKKRCSNCVQKRFEKHNVNRLSSRKIIGKCHLLILLRAISIELENLLHQIRGLHVAI